MTELEITDRREWCMKIASNMSEHLGTNFIENLPLWSLLEPTDKPHMTKNINRIVLNPGKRRLKQVENTYNSNYKKNGGYTREKLKKKLEERKK